MAQALQCDVASDGIDYQVDAFGGRGPDHLTTIRIPVVNHQIGAIRLRYVEFL